MRIAISTSLVDNDAVKLVEGVVESVRDGTIPNTKIECLISTRERGESSLTDQRLKRLEESDIPVVAVSARRNGRVGKRISVTDEDKNRYDELVMKEAVTRTERLPEVVVMLGDMIIHGPEWCCRMASLNLHPDLPLSLGGTEGIYWDVIGQWVREGRKEGGGMIHLAVPALDVGTPVAYFRIPLRGVVNGVNLGGMWDQLPKDSRGLEALIAQQTGLKDRLSHPLFVGLRRAEAYFEPGLIRQTLVSLARGEIRIQDGKIFDERGTEIKGLDLTKEVVGERAIPSRAEGNFSYGKEVL